MNAKNLIYAFACLAFTIVIGAAVYEHIAVVPQWSAAPPSSLTMMQGKYGLNAAPFWQMIHPVTLLLLITTLVLHWKTDRKKNILTTLIGYVIVLAVTATYFVPELISIVGTPFSETVDAALTQRASTWEFSSIVRLLLLIVLAIILFLGLARSGEKVRG